MNLLYFIKILKFGDTLILNILKEFYYHNIRLLWEDHLFKNFFFIMSTSILNAFIGFIFWIIAARLYSQSDIGIAAALISSIVLLSTFSTFGFPQSVVRYLPERDQGGILGTSIIITFFLGLIIGSIFLIFIDYWSPQLDMITKWSFSYLTFLLSLNIFTIVGTSFIALRKSNLFFFQNLLLFIRICILFPLIFLGSLGIFFSYGLSILLGTVIAIFIFMKILTQKLRFDFLYLKESIGFSVGNFFSQMLITAPNQIIPILVINIINPEATAQYYIVYSITAILFMIPTSFGTALFVEGSHGEPIKKILQKTISGVYLILIPLIFIMYIFGYSILSIFGKSYQDSINLLNIMIFSSVFVSFYQICVSINKIQKDVKSLIVSNAIVFCLLIGFSYILTEEMGINGLGWAWIISYGISCIFIGLLIILKRKRSNEQSYNN